jgi:hypothetical protein
MLKIPKEYLKAIDRRRTDNPMTKRKRTKEQTLSTKYYGTVKTEQHDPPPNKKKNKKGKIRR